MKRHNRSSAHKWGLPPFSPRAFTLVELLVVIAIIGILVSLTIPAVMHVRVTAKNTAIVMELKNLETACQSYKAKFGEYPPDFAGINLPGPEGQAAKDAVMRHIHKAFPWYTGTWSDFYNFMSNYHSGIPMTPQTALTFWLGGLRDPTTGRPNGFSANPANPFDDSSTSRIGPFFDFDLNRLNNYRYWPQEADGASTGAGAITYFRAENGAYFITGSTVKYATDGGANVRPAVDSRISNAAWINPQSFQIFSSGQDKMYSDLTSGDRLLFPSGDNYDPVGHTFDDITNFSGRTLESAIP